MDEQLQAWHAAGDWFDFRGWRIFCRADGSNDPPLLLIHGFPTASWDWHAVWEQLAGEYRLITLDLLGFGFSAKPRGHAYSIFEQADLIEALLDRCGVSRVDVVAHDYGVTVVQELLARHNEGQLPVQLESICFLNGGLIPGAHRPLLIQKLLAGPLGPLLARLVTKAAFRRNFDRILARDPGSAEIDRLWTLVNHNDGRAIMHRLIRYMAERDTHAERWVGALGRTEIPLALINGTLDPISGGHVVEPFVAAAPGAKIFALADVGHYPQLEAPAEVLAALRSFLSP
ncbi:MAG: alpha/beta hydrolase [Xanthomonadales bacterium]|nr:alpha/beta hydrolase [Xanthomonadales bacterium]